MRDTAIIVKEIIEYCEKEQKYSYVELKEYAKKINMIGVVHLEI